MDKQKVGVGVFLIGAVYLLVASGGGGWFITCCRIYSLNNSSSYILIGIRNKNFSKVRVFPSVFDLL